MSSNGYKSLPEGAQRAVQRLYEAALHRAEVEEGARIAAQGRGKEKEKRKALRPVDTDPSARVGGGSN